jgi:hypothetical protein
MNKKSYMFMLDAAIAIVMLIVGMAILFYSFYQENRPVYFADQLSDDIVGVLSNTKVDDLCMNLDEPGCICPKYSNLSLMVCSGTLKNVDTDVLSMLSEVIENGLFASTTVEKMIHEMFVDNYVIDEKRFGFALLYYSSSMGTSLELYNTECFPPNVCPLP